MRRFWLFTFVSLLFGALSFADQLKIDDLSGGMWSSASPGRIPDNAAAYIQNFYTDLDGIAAEREGFNKRDTTVLGGTATVTGLWSFVDTAGDEWIVSFSSRTFYKNRAGATPTSFGPSVSTSNKPDAAVNLGKIWFTNGVDNVWWFDGTSTGAVSAAPKGRLIEAWRNRIAISNISGALSTIRFSADGDGTSWTLGGNATDPFSIQVGGANDGQYVRCMETYADTLIAGRKYDLWGMDGFDQGDVVLRSISNSVGCVESGTMLEFDNTLMWLSNRGVEQMRGRTIKMISEPVHDITDLLVGNAVNERSFTQTAATDWTTGDFSAPLSTSPHPGDIGIYPWFLGDNFSDGDFTASPTWTADAGTWLIVTGELGFDNPVPVGGAAIRKASTQATGAWRFKVRLGAGSTAATIDYHFMGQSYAAAADATGTKHYTEGYSLRIAPNGVVGSGLKRWNSSGANTNLGTDVAFATGGGQHEYIITRNSSGVMNVYEDGVLKISATDTTYTTSAIEGIVIIRNGSATDNPALFDDLYHTGDHENNATVNTSTSATYVSPIITVGSLISSWGPISISDVVNGGTLTYEFGTSASASTSTISDWAVIENGDSPSQSTATYAAFRASFGADASTDTARLSDFSVTWSEGSSNPSPVATVYDRRYLMSFTTSSASGPYLDAVLVYQRNNSWTTFKGINASSFALWRDSLYFGNSVGNGYVYKFDVGDNDDGEAIVSILRTKSYDSASPITPKSYRNIWASYLADHDYSGEFQVLFDLDQYESDISAGIASMDESRGRYSAKFPVPANEILEGNEIQFVVTKSDTGSRLKLLGLNAEYEVKEPR